MQAKWIGKPHQNQKGLLNPNLGVSVPWSGTSLSWFGSNNSTNRDTNGTSSSKFCFSLPSLVLLQVAEPTPISSNSDGGRRLSRRAV